MKFDKVKKLETVEDWEKFQSRFDDYENGLEDTFSELYQNRGIAKTVSIDEIAERWQRPENYSGINIVTEAFSFLGYALAAKKIDFTKYKELKSSLRLGDVDSTYETCIKALMKAGY